MQTVWASPKTTAILVLIIAAVRGAKVESMVMLKYTLTSLV